MHTIKRGRVVATGAIAALLSVSLAACGGGAGGNTCKDATVNAGIVNSATDAVLFIADQKGYFKDEGLKVKFTKFDSAAKMIAPLGAGQLDVGAGAPSAGFYNAVARDIDVRIVADKGSLVHGYDYMPVLVRKDLVDSGKVKTVADLKGLKVAEPAEGTSTASTLASVLESGGLDYDDVDHQFVGFPEHVSSFANGAIDASATTEPTASVIVDAGTAVRMFDSTDTYDKQQLAVVLYSGAFSEDRSAVAQCFMKAYVKASKDYNAAVADGTWDSGQGKEAVSIISKAVGISPELFAKTVPSFIAPDGAVNTESLEKDYTFFKERGWLEGDRKADFSKLVDTTFVEKATKQGSNS